MNTQRDQFQNLGAEQGLQEVLQVMKHLCGQTTTGKILQVLIEYYQLKPGIRKPILKDTALIPWSQAVWLDKLTNFYTV